MAGSSEETRFRGIGPLGLPPGGLQFIRGAFSFGNVRKGDDNAFDSVVLPTVGEYSTDIPDPLRVELTFDRRVGFQNRSRIRQERGIGIQRPEILEWPSNVGGYEPKERLCGRREQTNLKSGVEKDRRHVRAVQDILQIVRGRLLPLQCLLQLAVQCGKLLVQ